MTILFKYQKPIEQTLIFFQMFGDGDGENNFMTSWTVMTPIPAYCGNRPTVTLANIS